MPEDVVYDIWPGSRIACDCLERIDSTIAYDRECERGKSGKERSDDCKHAFALAPMVLNVINGVRFCGKLGQYALNEAIRPIKVVGGAGKWECPSDYLPCNEQFFETEGGEDYVICYPEKEASDLHCPVTSIALNTPTGGAEDDTLYKWQPIKSENEDDTRGLYISKQVMQHGIEQVRVSPQEPCHDDGQYSAAENQQFYFTELRKNQRTCSQPGYIF